VRQLAAWEEARTQLADLDATNYAASVDTREQTQEVVERGGINFPVAYGVTIDEALSFGAWKAEDHHGLYIQPAEFLLGRGGVVLGSMYASGPVGRMTPEEAVRLITNRERRRREQEGN
jgi:peroxiredoxin